ncbi:MAG: trypsin-like serine protease [Actinomycetales bacterium]|nr:trypsin-like serine protease [Actinomycetales bacterium]
MKSPGRFVGAWLTVALSLTLVPSSLAIAAPVKPDVVNGVEGPSPDFGFLVALGDRAYYEDYGMEKAQFCGGSLVTSSLVVTAAHCVSDARAADLVVGTADIDGDLSGNDMRISYVAAIKVHPNYDTRSQENDVAVITLATALRGSPTIQPVTAQEAATLTAARAPVSVAGWGAINQSKPWRFPEVYRVGDLVVFPDSACGGGQTFTLDGVKFSGYGPNEVNSRVMLCAEGVIDGQIVDSCVGDSGGPLIGGLGSDRRLVGIVSWGLEQCATRAGAGVYSRVAAFTAFLKSAGVPFAPAPDEGPQPPTIDRVTSTPTSLTVTVSAAATGTTPDSYSVSAIDEAGLVSSCTIEAPTGGSGRCTISGLLAAQDYTVTAIAIAGDLVSAPSKEIVVQPVGLPSTPRIIYAKAQRGGFAGFIVDNLHGNGSPLTERVLRCTSRGETTRRAPIESGGLALLSRLTRGATYRCEAIVANEYGRATSRPVTLVAK